MQKISSVKDDRAKNGVLQPKMQNAQKLLVFCRKSCYIALDDAGKGALCDEKRTRRSLVSLRAEICSAYGLCGARDRVQARSSDRRADRHRRGGARLYPHQPHEFRRRVRAGRERRAEDHADLLYFDVRLRRRGVLHGDGRRRVADLSRAAAGRDRAHRRAGRDARVLPAVGRDRLELGHLRRLRADLPVAQPSDRRRRRFDDLRGGGRRLLRRQHRYDLGRHGAQLRHAGRQDHRPHQAPARLVPRLPRDRARDLLLRGQRTSERAGQRAGGDAQHPRGGLRRARSGRPRCCCWSRSRAACRTIC